MELPDSQLIDVVMKMEAHIASIDAKLSSFCSRIADHERRLTDLEKAGQDGGMSGLARILAKTLMYAVIAIGSLAGAGGLIAKLFT